MCGDDDDDDVPCTHTVREIRGSIETTVSQMENHRKRTTESMFPNRLYQFLNTHQPIFNYSINCEAQLERIHNRNITWLDFSSLVSSLFIFLSSRSTDSEDGVWLLIIAVWINVIFGRSRHTETKQNKTQKTYKQFPKVLQSIIVLCIEFNVSVFIRFWIVVCARFFFVTERIQGKLRKFSNLFRLKTTLGV